MRIAAFMENISQASQDTGKTVEELLKEFYEAGLESVYAGYSWSVEGREEKVMGMLKDSGLVLEGLWDNIPFNTLSDEECESAYKTIIDCAETNGAKHVLIIPGIFHSYESGEKVTREEVVAREPEIQRMIEKLREAVFYGRSKGIAVTLEDYDVYTSPVLFPEIMRRFFEEIPELTCSFDTGNFIPTDRDCMDEFPYYKNRIATLHLKDRVENDDQGGLEKQPYITESGRKYYAAAVGHGDMHIPEVVEEMKAIGYEGAGIIELFSCDDTENKILKSIRWMKENAK